jgi:hypothetical protein
LESNQRLSSLAGLHQLLHPIIGLIDTCLPRSFEAIDAAFGVSEELEAPDLFASRLPPSSLCVTPLTRSPVVLIVDDAQWLDHSSMDALAFVARRLESEPVILVAAVRAGHATPFDGAHLATLDLERLSASAAATLLDQTAPELHPILRARVLSEAAGNPLALVELARIATNAAEDYERIAPAPTTLTARLRGFASRLRDLPAVTCAALLVAALDSRVSLKRSSAACSRFKNSASVGVLEPALDAALIEVVEGAVRFRHPLIRSAVRLAAGPGQVQATYAALATIVDNPERRLWHRAMAAEGPDEEIATALESHARAAGRRGAVTVAGAALERAAALTADPHRKRARLVSAAEIAYELGLAAAVRRLIQQAETLDRDPMDSARLAWLRQMVTATSGTTGATRTSSPSPSRCARAATRIWR